MHSKAAAVLNFQLRGSIPNSIWCIQKQRSSISSFSDPFQMGSGAFKSSGLQFSAFRISIPNGIWCIQKQWSSIFSFPDPFQIGIRGVQKQRSSIFKFWDPFQLGSIAFKSSDPQSGAFTSSGSQFSTLSDPFQMGSGAFKSNGPRFSASRIHSKSDLVHSKASVLNFQLLGSIPYGI